MNHNWSTRLNIEKFVYEKGTNVALYNAEHSKVYQDFQKKLERLLNNQVKAIANYKETLPLLMSLAKAASSELQNQVSVLVSKFTFQGELNLQDFLVWAGTQGGQSFLDKMDIYGVFGLTNPKVIEYFGNYTNLRISTVNDYTKKWISETIQRGKSEGLTPFQVQQLLIDEGKKIDALRAERIVLSETAKAMTYVERESSHRMGLTTFEWHTSRDERVCNICGPLDGKKSDENGIYEGGIDGPPAHVSCRCFENAVIPEGWEAPAHVWMGE